MPLSPEKLFSASGHQPATIDEFYSELKAGVVGGQIEEVRYGEEGVLTRNEVRVMVRDQKAGKIVAEVPEHDPKGMGVRGILTSELFGLRSDLDLATLQLLDEKRDLASRDELTEPEKVRLAELRSKRIRSTSRGE